MVSGSCTQYDIRIVQLKMAVQGLVVAEDMLERPAMMHIVYACHDRVGYDANAQLRTSGV